MADDLNFEGLDKDAQEELSCGLEPDEVADDIREDKDE